MDPRSFSLVAPDVFARVQSHVLSLVKERAGRNEPCPCGSGKKYKACHLPIDAGTERMERLLGGNPLPPAPIEYDLMGVTEHVSSALRGDERLKRLGERFDTEAESPEPVEWAVAALDSAARHDSAHAIARTERALTGRFDPCLDYLAVARRCSSESAAELTRMLRLVVKKAETYSPHPLLRGDLLAESRANLAISIASIGEIPEAVRLVESIPGTEGISSESAAGVATVAMGLDRSDTAMLILEGVSPDPKVKLMRDLLATRVLPSGFRVTPVLPGVWDRSLAVLKASRTCPLCGAVGLRTCRVEVNNVPTAAYCIGCRVVACLDVTDADDATWEGFEADRTALGAHLAVYSKGPRV